MGEHSIILVLFWIEITASASISNFEENPGALSEKKCLEYYPEPEFPPLSIAGGNLSLAKEFPHMAAIGYGDEDNIEWLCGGSLISERFVLTAAHCVVKNNLPKFIRLGDLDLSTEEDDAQPQDFTITRIIPHPLYKPPAKYHDIALLQLDRDANFTSYVSPACLNTETELNGTRLTATGWGRVGYVDDVSSYLLKVYLDHVPHEQCVQAFGRYSKDQLPQGIVEESQICAGMVKGQDTCQGDSGGPLQKWNIERTFDIRVHTVYAVTSFGKPCALSAAPSVYTRVSKYIPWIESVIWGNE